MSLWKAGGGRTYIWKFVEVVSAIGLPCGAVQLSIAASLSLIASSPTNFGDAPQGKTSELQDTDAVGLDITIVQLRAENVRLRAVAAAVQTAVRQMAGEDKTSNSPRLQQSLSFERILISKTQLFVSQVRVFLVRSALPPLYLWRGALWCNRGRATRFERFDALKSSKSTAAASLAAEHVSHEVRIAFHRGGLLA
jgi:hypothetical protein